MNMGSTTGTWTLVRSAGSWKRAPILACGGEMASTSTLATTDFGEWLWVLVRGGADCAWVLLVSYGCFWKNFLFFVAAVALFALGNLDFAFALVSFSLGPVFGC